MEIKKMIKTITLGEMKFKVCTNREILVDTLENNEEYTEIMFNQAEKSSKFDVDKVDVKSLLKAKKLNKMLKIQDLIPSVVKYALPKMLELANDNTNSNDIISYAEENEADDVLYEALHEFLLMAFTQGKQDKKPKVKFAIN